MAVAEGSLTVPTFRAVVEEVKILNSGTNKNGKPWVLLGVTAGGMKLKTFDKTWQSRVGETVDIDYDETVSDRLDRNGKPFIDNRIRDPKKQPGGGGSQAAALTEIRDLLKEILRVLQDAKQPV